MPKHIRQDAPSIRRKIMLVLCASHLPSASECNHGDCLGGEQRMRRDVAVNVLASMMQSGCDLALNFLIMIMNV